MMRMPRQYYNDAETGKSYALLVKLAKDVDFVLVGGWAVNLYTGMQRSKDLDIAIEPDGLDYFRRYGIRDYGIGVKYSVIDDVHVDLFINGVPIRSASIPVKEMLSSPRRINGIRVVDKNILVLLKLSGYFRFDEIKSAKDVIDVVSLLFYAGIDMKAVKMLVDKYKVEDRKGPLGMLEYLDRGERLWEFICDSEREYTRLAGVYRKEIKHTFD